MKNFSALFIVLLLLLLEGGCHKSSGSDDEGPVAVKSKTAADRTLGLSAGTILTPPAPNAVSASLTASSTPTASTTTLISIFPTSCTVSSVPLKVLLNFTAPIEIPTNLSIFKIETTCSTPPAVVSVDLNDSKTILSVDLVPGHCNNADTVTLTVDPAELFDANHVAVAGSAVTETYTLSMAPPVTKIDPTVLNATPHILQQSSPFSIQFQGIVAQKDIKKTTLSGTVDCEVSILDPVPPSTQGTISFTNCTGDGLFTFSVNGSSLSAFDYPAITVDNTPPSFTSISPATAMVRTVPASVLIGFSEAVKDLKSTDVILSGTCSQKPIVSPSMSTDKKVATITLLNGACKDTETLILTLTQLTDLAGNQNNSPGASVTYTVNSVGPTTTADTTQLISKNSLLSNTTRIDIPFTYTTASQLKPNIASSQSEWIDVTTLSGNPVCSFVLSNATKAGGTITLQNCTGDGTIAFTIKAGTALDAIGNPSLASSTVGAILIRNTPPRMTGTTPAVGLFTAGNVIKTIDWGGGRSTTQTSIEIRFDENISSNPSQWQITGTCGTGGFINQGGYGNTISMAIGGLSCTSDGAYFSVSLPVTDSVGNSRSIKVTYIFSQNLASAIKMYTTTLIDMSPDGGFPNFSPTSPIITRQTSTARCSLASQAKNFTCKNTVSFLGFSADNGVKNLPTSYGVPTNQPIVGPNGTSVIASSWAGLLSGSAFGGTDPSSAGNALYEAGVLKTGDVVWTGFQTDGSAVQDHESCNNWATPNVSSSGTFIQSTNNSWGKGLTACQIDNGSKAYTSILCLCW